MSNRIRERSEIPVEDTWAVEDLYPSDEAWEAELATIADEQQLLAAYAGKMCESAQSLLGFLTNMERIKAKIELLANYCMRKSDVDTRDGRYQAMMGQFRAVSVGLSAAISFETPEIMALDEDKLNAFYAEEPKLEHFRRYLSNIRRRKEHILSPAEEKLLAAAGDVTSSAEIF